MPIGAHPCLNLHGSTCPLCVQAMMSRLVVLACLALSCWATMAGAEGTGPYIDGMTFVSMLQCTTDPRYYLGSTGVPHHLSRDMLTCIYTALLPSCWSSLQK